MPVEPLRAGYRETGPVDDRFEARGPWHRFWHRLGGLIYHGVNDVEVAGMMPFLNWRYRQDLAEARAFLG